MTLRESIQADINAARANIDAWTAQLASTDQTVGMMLSADVATLKAFWAQFAAKLTAS
ncbi:MAG: hypothetical protein JWQ89_3697 [Devosia sp.]|uniref:hypothetical protein n=1 Tax=Devosia sp. TaxID=1871048 RepID=UPI0026021CD7|nr:hypothetical protein [Devosia sp.]MDB5541970.1 hypothetical protein [Devosia sp.]